MNEPHPPNKYIGAPRIWFFWGNNYHVRLSFELPPIKAYKIRKCKCGRCHSDSYKDKKRGDKFFETMGWRKIDNHWMCPYCTGNTEFLDAVFGKAKE
jgi:hypothetical protein